MNAVFQSSPPMASFSKRSKIILARLGPNAQDRTSLKCAIALSRIHAYLRAARKQVHAIEALDRRADPKKTSYSSTMIQAFIHAHLYFICWAAIGRMIEVIRRCSGLEAPNKVWKKHHGEIKRYTDARDHFEHYEERLPGGKAVPTLPNPGDYGSLKNGTFSLGGYRWIANRHSFEQLKNIVDELSTGIFTEGHVLDNRLKKAFKE